MFLSFKGMYVWWSSWTQCNAIPTLTTWQSPAQDSPHFRHQLQVRWSPGHLHFWPTSHKFGSLHNSLRINNLQQRLTEFRKAWYLWLQFYYQNYGPKLVKRKDAWGQVRKGPKHKLPCLQDTSAPRHTDVWLPTREAQPSFSVEFSWGFIREANWSHYWPSPAPLSLPRGWKVGPS